MSKIISMQDMRVSLARIADQAQAGETFVVIRNSKPAFRIVPAEKSGVGPAHPDMSLDEITLRMSKAAKTTGFSPDDLDAIIRDAHRKSARS